MRTACLFCLQRGMRRRETLEHVVQTCPAYNGIRDQPGVADICQTGLAGLACMHRDVWSWHDMRVVRRMLVDMQTRRRQLLKDSMPRRGQLMNAKIARLWAEAVGKQGK